MSCDTSESTIRSLVLQPRVSFELSPDWLTALSSEPMSSQFLELQRSLDPDGLTRLLPPSEAVQMLSAIPNINSFTPQGHFIVNTRPYRARCRPNFEYMVRSCSVFASFKAAHPHEVRAFSFGTSIKVNAAVRHRVDLYCHTESDRSQSAFVHLLMHIVLLSHSKFKVPVNIGIWLPTNTNKTQLEDFLVGKLRVSRWLTEPTFSNDLLLLESDPHDFSKL